MPTISTTTPPQKNTVKAVQLKALEERQKAQELAMAKATQYQQIESPWQGAANMLNSFFTARKGSALQAQEDAARNELAKIRAGFGPEGPTMAQIQQVGQYDQDAADKMQADLLQRNFTTKEREAGQTYQTTREEDQQAEDMKRLGITEGGLNTRQESQIKSQQQIAEDNRIAEKVRLGLQLTSQEQIAANRIAAEKEANELSAKTQLATNANTVDASRYSTDSSAATAANQLKLQQEKEAREAGKPPDIQSVPQVLDAYNTGKYGPVGSKQAQELRDADIAKLQNIAGGQSQEITVNTEDGAVTVKTGAGGGGGGGSGSGKGGKVAAPTMAGYQADEKAASDVKNGVAQLKQALKNPGYTGPGGTLFGTPIQGGADWAASLFGKDAQTAMRGWMGDPASRALIESGATQSVLANASKLPGAISNKEIGFLGKLAVNLNNRPDANEVVADVANRMADNVQLRSSLAAKWLADPAHGGSLDAFEREVWTPWIDSHPILSFNEQTQQVEVIPIGPRADGTTPAPDATAPAGGGGGEPPPGANVKTWNPATGRFE
jgi:hypothetical protein